MENAGSGPKIGQSLKVLRDSTQSCDRFLGFDRFLIISMLRKQWTMQISRENQIQVKCYKMLKFEDKTNLKTEEL